MLSRVLLICYILKYC